MSAAVTNQYVLIKSRNNRIMKNYQRTLLALFLLPLGASFSVAQEDAGEGTAADSPVEVTGAFSLKSGIIRGDDLQSALLDAVVAATASPTVPPELQDPAYDRYVNMADLAVAWRSQDAAALTDAALLLLEGERILMRPHAKLPADKVLQLAAKVAAEKQDKTTLDRLKKAAELHGKKELAAQLTASNKLASAVRSEEGLSIAVDAVTPEEFAAFHDLADRIRAARIAGDPTELQNLKEAILTGQALPAQLRQHLLAQLEKQGAVAQDGRPDAAISALTRLGGANRGWFSDATGISTPDPIRKIAPNGLSTGHGGETHSNLMVVTPPWIDTHGNIYGGSGNTGGSNGRVGRAKLQFTSSGKAYWVSDYRDGYGRVQSPVKAHSQYDRQATASGSSTGSSTSSADYRILSDGRVYAGSSYVGKAGRYTLSNGTQIWIYKTPSGRLVTRS